MEASLLPLTDSTGLPLARAPTATAHQNVQNEGSLESWLILETLLNVLPMSSAPNCHSPHQSMPKARSCRGMEGTMIFTIASRMLLTTATRCRSSGTRETMRYDRVEIDDEISNQLLQVNAGTLPRVYDRTHCLKVSRATAF